MRASATTTVTATPEQVWAVLSDHEGMARWAPGLKVDLVRHGEFERNGAGAQRRFTPLGVLPSFTEEIVDFEPGQQLSYRLVSGLPFRNYTGEVRLRPIAYGTRIDYTVSADNRLPGVAEAMSHALLFALKRAVQQAVGKVG